MRGLSRVLSRSRPVQTPNHYRQIFHSNAWLGRRHRRLIGGCGLRSLRCQLLIPAPRVELTDGPYRQPVGDEQGNKPASSQQAAYTADRAHQRVAQSDPRRGQCSRPRPRSTAAA